MASEDKRTKAEQKRANQEAAGIPDSKPFISGDAPEPEILNCHVGGVLVRELPVEVQNRIVYRQTDEGIAQANEGKSDLRISFGADSFTKACEQRKDMIIDRGMEPWEAPNPMGDLEKAYVRPGFKGKFLSPRKCDKDGTRGYVMVKDENGRPVKLRDMMLAEMPIERVKARTKFYSEKTAQAVGAAKQQYLDSSKISVDGE
jgi:hypothetical protein